MYAQPLGFPAGYGDSDLQDMTAIGERLPSLPVAQLPTWLPGSTYLKGSYADPATRAGTWLWLVGAATYLTAPRLLGKQGKAIGKLGGWTALFGLGAMFWPRLKGNGDAEAALMPRDPHGLDVEQVTAELEATASEAILGSYSYGQMGPGGIGMGLQTQSSPTSSGTIGPPPSTPSSAQVPTEEHAQRSSRIKMLEAQAARQRLKIDKLIIVRRNTRKLRDKAGLQRQIRSERGALAAILSRLAAAKSRQRRRGRVTRRAGRREEAGRPLTRSAKAALQRERQHERERVAGPMDARERAAGPMLAPMTPAATLTESEVMEEPLAPMLMAPAGITSVVEESPVSDDLPMETKEDALPETPIPSAFQITEPTEVARPMMLQPVWLGAAALGVFLLTRKKGKKAAAA